MSNISVESAREFLAGLNPDAIANLAQVARQKQLTKEDLRAMTGISQVFIIEMLDRNVYQDLLAQFAREPIVWQEKYVALIQAIAQA